MIISEVTSPHTKKVIASARLTGQMLGSGNFCGGRTVHPGCDSGGAGFGSSMATRFLHKSVRCLRFRNDGFVANLTVPACEQSENSTKINQTRRNPHKQAAELLVFGGRQAPLVLNEGQNAEPVHWMQIDRADLDGRERDDDSKNRASDARAEKINHSRKRRQIMFSPRSDDRPPKSEAHQKQGDIL